MKEKQILKKSIDLLYGKNPKDLTLLYDSKNKKIGVCHKGFVMYLFDPEGFPLKADVEKLPNIMALLDRYDYKPAMKTGMIEHKGTILTRLESTDRTIHCHVQTELLKLFEEPRFEIKGRKEVIRVYEDDELKGIVLPVNVP